MPPMLPVMPGVRPIPGKASTTTAVLPRNNSVWPRCGCSVAFADLIRFQGQPMGAATPGRHVHGAKHGAGIRNQAAEQELKPVVKGSRGGRGGAKLSRCQPANTPLQIL